MTKDEITKVHTLAKEHEGNMELAALAFLGIDPVPGDGNFVPVGCESAVYGIIAEVTAAGEQKDDTTAAGEQKDDTAEDDDA